MAGDLLDRYARLPADLQPQAWLKQGAPFSGTDAGKALAATLVALEAAFKRVALDELRVPKAPFASLDELERVEKSAKQAYRDRVLPLITRAGDVRQQGIIAAKICQTDARYKAAARPAAEIAKAASDLASDFKDLNALFRPFDDARSALVKASDHLAKLLMPHIQALGKGLDACQKTPTRDTWERQCRAPCAAIVNAVRNSRTLKDACWAAWKAQDGDGFLHALKVAEKSAGSDPKAQKKLEEVILRMCKDLRPELKRLLDLIKD